MCIDAKVAKIYQNHIFSTFGFNTRLSLNQGSVFLRFENGKFGLPACFYPKIFMRVAPPLLCSSGFLDRMKPAALVKILSQCAEFYQEVQKLLTRNGIRGIWDKVILMEKKCRMIQGG